MLAAAPSKVPFYIAGGLLAAWAVVHLAFSAGRAEAPSARRVPATQAPVPVEASS